MNDHYRQIHCTTNELAVKTESEADEWGLAGYAHSDSSYEALNGKIVARMPDLGDCKSFSETNVVREAAVRKIGKRLQRIGYAGWSMIRSSGAACIGFCRRNGKAEKKSEGAASSGKRFYSRMIAVGVVLLLCGVFLIFKGGKKKSEDTAKDAVPAAKVESVVAAKETPKPTATPEGKPATPDPKIAADKAAAEKAAAEKLTAEKAAAAKVAADKLAAEKAAAAKAAADKLAAEKAAAAKAAADKLAAEKAAAAKAAADKLAAEKKDPNSPWDRPVSDGYSPWTMTSAQRQNGTTENIPVVSPVAAAPTQIPTTAPIQPAQNTQPVAMAPMTAMTGTPVQTVAPMNTLPMTAVMPQPAMPYAPVASGFATSSNYAGTASRTGYPGAPVQGYHQPAQAAYPANPYANTPMAAQRVAPQSGRIPIAESSSTYQGHPGMQGGYPVVSQSVASMPAGMTNPAATNPAGYVQTPPQYAPRYAPQQVQQQIPQYAPQTASAPIPYAPGTVQQSTPPYQPTSYQQPNYQTPGSVAAPNSYPTTPAYPSAYAPSMQQPAGNSYYQAPSGHISVTTQSSRVY